MLPLDPTLRYLPSSFALLILTYNKWVYNKVTRLTTRLSSLSSYEATIQPGISPTIKQTLPLFDLARGKRKALAPNQVRNGSHSSRCEH